MSSSSAKTSAVGARAHDASVGHHDGAVGVLGDQLHVVRDDEDRRALVVELAQQSRAARRRARDPARRSARRGRAPARRSTSAVPTESRRFWPPDSRNGCVPALSASPNRSSSAFGALAHLVVGQVAQSQTVRDLVEDGVRDELVLGVLEDEADPRRQRARIAAAHVEVADAHGAARRRDDAGDRLDEGRLAGAVGADDRDELARRRRRGRCRAARGCGRGGG